MCILKLPSEPFMAVFHRHVKTAEVPLVSACLPEHSRLLETQNHFNFKEILGFNHEIRVKEMIVSKHGVVQQTEAASQDQTNYISILGLAGTFSESVDYISQSPDCESVLDDLRNTEESDLQMLYASHNELIADSDWKNQNVWQDDESRDSQTVESRYWLMSDSRLSTIDPNAFHDAEEATRRNFFNDQVLPGQNQVSKVLSPADGAGGEPGRGAGGSAGRGAGGGAGRGASGTGRGAGRGAGDDAGRGGSGRGASGGAGRGARGGAGRGARGGAGRGARGGAGRGAGGDAGRGAGGDAGRGAGGDAGRGAGGNAGRGAGGDAGRGGVGTGGGAGRGVGGDAGRGAGGSANISKPVRCGKLEDNTAELQTKGETHSSSPGKKARRKRGRGRGASSLVTAEQAAPQVQSGRSGNCGRGSLSPPDSLGRSSFSVKWSSLRPGVHQVTIHPDTMDRSLTVGMRLTQIHLAAENAITLGAAVGLGAQTSTSPPLRTTFEEARVPPVPEQLYTPGELLRNVTRPRRVTLSPISSMNIGSSPSISAECTHDNLTEQHCSTYNLSTCGDKLVGISPESNSRNAVDDGILTTFNVPSPTHTDDYTAPDTAMTISTQDTSEVTVATIPIDEPTILNVSPTLTNETTAPVTPSKKESSDSDC